MKLRVLISRWIMLPILLATIAPLSAETSVECTRPPGERVTCEDHQMAVCDVKEGAVYGSCSTPPDSDNQAEVAAWMLSKIIGKYVSPDEVEQGSYNDILSAGRWIEDERVVTFTPPSWW